MMKKKMDDIQRENYDECEALATNYGYNYFKLLLMDEGGLNDIDMPHYLLSDTSSVTGASASQVTRGENKTNWSDHTQRDLF